MSHSRILVLSAIAFAFSAFNCLADDNICGPPPVFTSTQSINESVKGELKGEAQILSRLVGNSELSGRIETARTTIYQTSDQAFAAQKDAYLAYMFCTIVMTDRTLTVEQKIDAINQFRRPLPTRSGSTGIYTAPGAVTRDTVLDNSQIIGCGTGIENHGVQENLLMKNSTIGCAARLDRPPASPPTTINVPNTHTTNRSSSGLYNAPGVTTLNTAIMNSNIHGCGNGLRFETSHNGMLWDDVQIRCHPFGAN